MITVSVIIVRASPTTEKNKTKILWPKIIYKAD